MSWPDVPRTVRCTEASLVEAALRQGFTSDPDAWIRLGRHAPEAGWVGVWVGMNVPDGDVRLDWPCSDEVLAAVLAGAHRLAVERLRLHAYRSAFRGSGSWQELTDDQVHLLDVSDGFVRATGLDREAALGRTPAELFRGGTHEPAFYAGMTAQLEAQGVWSGDLLGRRRDGSLAVVEARIEMVRRGRQVLAHHAFKRQAVTGASQSLHDWVAASSGRPWFLVRQPDGVVLELNDAAASLLGRRRVELVGQPLGVVGIAFEPVEPEAVASVEQLVGRRIYDVSSHGRQIGEVSAALVVLQDVTELVERAQHLNQLAVELEEARDQALAANRAKSAFLASMSHELRTPLNAVIGYSELVMEGVDATHREDLERIHQAGSHLMQLVDEVLDLARIEAGESEVKREEVDLHALLEEVAGALALKAQRRGIGFAVRGGGCSSTDAQRVRQIVFNFAGNAVKYAVPGTVELGVDGREIYVQDEGPGLTPAQCKQLFAPFQQGDENSDGVGLGLAITQRAAELIGGSVSVSSAPGKGSRFSLWLPR